MWRTLGRILTPVKEGKRRIILRGRKKIILVDNWCAASLPCASVPSVSWEAKNGKFKAWPRKLKWDSASEQTKHEQANRHKKCKVGTLNRSSVWPQ